MDDDSNNPENPNKKDKLEKEFQVYQMRNRGMSFADVAAYFSISIDKAQKLYELAQKKHVRAQKKFNSKKFVVQSLVTFDDIMAQAWKDYNELTGSDKIKALALIKEVNNDKIKFIKELDPNHKKKGFAGHLQQPMVSGLPSSDNTSDSNTLQNSKVSPLDGWTSELKKLATDKLISSTFQTPLQEPAPDPNGDDVDQTPPSEKSN